MSVPTVMIMAGGTGGHVFPALAVARALREQQVEVVWLGTRRGLEARVVPAAGFAVEWISVSGLRGKGVLAWLAAPFRLMFALGQSLRVMARRRPGAVLGMGGFVSGPGGIAAWLSRRPLLIHEQNSVAGLTNRLLARLARRVFEGFPGSFPAASIKAETCGNPVRDEFFELPAPAERYAARQDAPRLLVVGGSQGALALNQTVAAAVASQSWQQAPQIRHQAGHKTLEKAQQAYADAGVAATVEAFIEDLADAYGWADLVICRAGAITVAELAAVGVAALLVPFPAAVDDHQTGNARHLVEAGAAELLPQSQMTPLRLGARLAELLPDRRRLTAMAEAGRRFARPDAGPTLTRACLALLSGDRP